MFQSRKFYLSLVGVIASSSTIAETVLAILEATSFSVAHSSLLQVAAASSALDVVSVCCIGLYTYQSVRPRSASAQSTTHKRALTSLYVFLCGAALIVGLALLVMIKSQWEEVQTSSRGPVSDWTRHVVAHIALWAVSCASQIVLYTSAFWSPTAPKLHAITTSGPRDSIMSDLRSNRFLMKSNQPSSLADTMHSPTYSAGSSQSLKSFRDSMRHVVRPATSRTTLIGRTSLTRDASIHSQAESFDHVPHSDGFDSWDTSSVSLQARDAVMQSVSSRRTALDPIPGSRPTTPAYSLEGPFNSELEEDVEELAPPPRMMHDYSRPSSPANSEAHIHPLFRSESPIPAPEATPGTNILASPFATQAITCPTRSINRIRSNSHLSQAREPKTRGRPSSPHASSRTPSPISRELTPPIPDYVLNSSPRSSLSISGGRRVPLQYSPDR
ncbi:hypothetical protein HBI56_020460 [Parastagonospora nodorum]|nr:hypothetical protein HBH53_002290 [Parastagonospora nodorum]KAH3971329.1 hypothetical protein HBH51_111850 [Parastagonospora nodorum]KAH3982226.1 hypothetical protein HBH52_075130 [Parastagonospora nodorum]KAH4041201.1 hypothetical protein HBI09_019430 [Parastagonospora nodorum]KAH4063341.1 hypothetical protein HBH50_188480 [Parastagonospora nodorum]